MTARLTALTAALAARLGGSRVGTAVLTPDLRIEDASSGLCRLLGRRADEVLGRSLIDFADARHAGTLAAAADDSLPAVVRFLRPDGVPVQAVVTCGHAAGASRVRCRLQDVTEAHRAGQQRTAVAELALRAQRPARDPQSVVTAAVQAARDALDASSCVAFRRTEDGALRIIATAGDTAAFPPTVPVDASQAGYTLLTGAPVFSNDLLREDRFLVPAVVFTGDLRRGVSAPVPEREGIRHVLLAHGRGPGRPFTAQDARFLQRVARIVGGALDRAGEGGAPSDPPTGPAFTAGLAFEAARGRARRAAAVELRRALAAGQLELRYQPVLDLAGDVVTGFEALLRWRHPERGMLLPGDFLGAADEPGLAVEIDRWVLATACAQLAGWPEEISVSVNVSAGWPDGELAAELAALLAAHRLDARRLVLEIPERRMLAPGTLPAVTGLRALGVRVALDDFGAGYTSLGALERLPLDVVKLDRSLLEALDEGGGRAALGAAIELGRALRLDVVAEGIERPSQLARLRDLGCPFGQGFLLGEPATPAQAGALLGMSRREAA